MPHMIGLRRRIALSAPRAVACAVSRARPAPGTPALLLRLLVFGLLLALAGLLAARADADDVTWQVSVGFSNAAKEGAWTPVFVDVANEGESQTGRIMVPVRVSAAGFTPRFADYVLPVDLPRHAKKRYVLYVPLLQGGGPDQVYLDLSRYRAKRDNPGGQNMRVARGGDLLIVAVGGEPGFLSFLSGKRGLGVTVARDLSQNQRYGPGAYSASESEAQVGRLEWTGLPDSWLGWDGVDAVVLGDAAFSGLSTAALEALRTWVQLGGTLIVPGGTLAPSVAASPIASLLPASVTGTVTLPDLSALAAWADAPAEQGAGGALISQLALRPDAQVLCGTVSQPLIVSRPAGSGRVVMTAFDFTASPLKYWNGQEAMWSNLLVGVARAPSRVTPREWADPWAGPFQGIVGAVSTMPEAELPSMALIVSFLLAYIVVLVPLNYSILNRLDRRELAWLTTPAIVAIFTFGAYGLGYAMRGGTVVLNRLGIVEAAAGSPIGRGHGYLGLFSPARTSYEIDLRAPASGARDLAQAEQRAGGRLAITAGAEQRIQNASMNMWTTRAFGIEYTMDLRQGLTGELEYDGKTMTGRVRNGTGLDLRNCRVIVGERMGKAVTIAPGAEKEVTFAEKTARAVAGSPYFHNPQSAARPELDEMALAAIFPQTGMRPGWYGGPGPGMGLSGMGPSMLPVLAATTREASVPATLARRQPQTKDTTVLLVDLPIHLARGPVIAVPAWLISSRVVGAEGNFNYNPYGGGFEIVQGSVTTEFALPTEGRPAQAGSLEVTLNVSNPGGPSAVPAKVSAYDFTRRRWETVLQASGGAGSPGWGMRGGGMGGGPGIAPVSLPHPQDFLSADGKVRVKVTAQSGAVRVEYLGLTAKVRVR
jgi:hypothetical protein